jgi:hypothetical protein
MSSDEQSPPNTSFGRKRQRALQLAPRKKLYAIPLRPVITHLLRRRTSRGTDPLVHYGRHFGRTVHALCNVNALLTNGMLRVGDQPDDTLTHEYVLWFWCHPFSIVIVATGSEGNTVYSKQYSKPSQASTCGYWIALTMISGILLS